MWPGLIAVKSVQNAEDSVKFVELDADAVVLSNHGRRQLDLASVPFQLLPSVKDAVGDDMETRVDTDIINDSDIVVAVAPGADFTLIERAYLYWLMVGGREGVDHTLQFQIERTKKLLQVSNIGESAPEHATQLSHFNRVGKPGQAAL